MNFSEDNPLAPETQNPDSPSSENQPEEIFSSAHVDLPALTELSGGSIQVPTILYAQRPDVPEDLRISWSWVHLICFVLFSFISLVIVQTILTIHYAPHEELSAKE